MVGVAGDGTLRVGAPSIGKHILRVVVAGGGSHHAEVSEQVHQPNGWDATPPAIFRLRQRSCKHWPHQDSKNRGPAMMGLRMMVFIGAAAGPATSEF